MKEFTFTISDPNGIHARPAGILVEKMQTFTSTITIIRDGKSCDGKKLFALMKLRVKNGESVVLRAEGTDEEAAVEAAKVVLTEHHLIG
jgi:phosphotransferase system HPr (HPr) family protein